MSDYEFKNTALAKLYEKFMNNGPWCTVKAVDGMLEAFRECDEKLADIQDERDHWKTMYGNACGDQDVLKESIRLLDGENRRLMAENKKLGQVLQNLNTDYDKLKNDRDRKAEAVVELAKKRDELQVECDKLQNNSGYLRSSRETWRSRAKHAEAEAVELAKKRDKLQEENEDLKKKLTEANDILEETNRDRNEWRRRALMTKLTSKVPDIKEEYTMTFTMDKADYKDLMKLLLNKSFGASPEYMRDFLKAFCEDHDSCRVCPLKECGSDLGSSFDSMSDEEIEKYYKIAIGAQPEREKPDLTFGDIVKVPWSHSDYIFIEALTSSIRLYSITKRRFVIVAKNEHLKWIGHIKK